MRRETTYTNARANLAALCNDVAATRDVIIIRRRGAEPVALVAADELSMQVKGGKEVTLTPGQTFYEGPDDVHVVDRNASSTKPAKFLVFLIKDKGAPALVPVK